MPDRPRKRHSTATRTIVLALGLALAQGCSVSASKASLTPNGELLAHELAPLVKDMESRLRNDDLRGVASFYDDDAMLINPSGATVSGRDAIDRYWSDLGRGIDWELTIHSVDGTTGLAYQRGVSRLTYEKAGKRNVSTVEFLLVWKRNIDGHWKIVVDAYW
ncbi:MAG: nuclear transport factor 2 family protein [Nannocystaceae bacterium]|nr:nuclear transport factor 2 family protein [Nannocystaceae bacterium]